MPDDRIPNALKGDPRFEDFLKVFDYLRGLLPEDLRLYDVENAPESALYELAATLGVLGFKGWLLASSTDSRRDLVRAAIALHKAAGTPWSVIESIRAAGYPNSTLIEGVHLPGGGFDPWAVTIELDSLATIDVAASGVPATVRELIEQIAISWLPIYARLDAIAVRLVLTLNGTQLLDGSTLLDGLPSP